ncbi:MAG: MATE family efflux transporter [Clostridiales bacterium]|nr:MATE family efflux transporter [Clostridiales bacterium]
MAKEQKDKEKALGSERVSSLLFRLAVPAIAAQIINLLYNMVDRMYIGHIPGAGVTLPAIMLISAFAALIGFGGAPRASICMGRGEHDRAEEILGNCVAAIVVLSVVLTIVFQIFGRNILLLFGASEQTLPYAVSYMRIYTLGTVFVQFSLGLNSFISAQGFTNVSMKTTLIGAVLNIILDPVFIFGLHMGVQGAALATILSQAVSCIWVLVFLCGKRTMLRIRKCNIRLTLSVILPVLALGVSPFIMQSTESVLQICFNTSLLKYGGNTAVGAMTILTSVMQFSMMPLQGLTQGMQPIVSYNFGAGNGDRVKQAFQLTLISCLSYSTLIWAVSMFCPQVLAGMFTDEAELLAYASWSMRVYMAASCIFGAQIACQQTFLALGNAKASLFLAVLRKIILLIPLIYILPAIFSDKAFAVFLAEPVADTLAVVTTVSLFLVTFQKTMRKLKKIEK